MSHLFTKVLGCSIHSHPGPPFINKVDSAALLGVDLGSSLLQNVPPKAGWSKGEGRRRPSLIENEHCPCKESTSIANNLSRSYCAFSTTKFSLSNPASLTWPVSFSRSCKWSHATQPMGTEPQKIYTLIIYLSQVSSVNYYNL